MSYIPHVEKDDVPETYRYLFTENDVGELNLFTALGNNPPVLQSYLRWGTTLWKDTGLTRQEVEIVILTIARELDSQYEWHQHVQLARECGLKNETISAIADETTDSLTERQKLLVMYTLAFLERKVNQSVHDTMATEFETDAVVGVTALASHYLATAYIIDSLGIQPDGTFVGWYPNRDG